MKDDFIQIRCSAAVKDKLQRAAAHRNLSLSRYLLACAQHRELPSRRPQPLQQRQLARTVLRDLGQLRVAMQRTNRQGVQRANQMLEQVVEKVQHLAS